MNMHVPAAAIIARRPAKARQAPISRDPALAAIEKFQSALTEYQKADRRHERLLRKLPEDIKRKPRAFYCSGVKLVDGRPVHTPIYVRSDFDIDDRCDAQIARIQITFETRPLQMKEELAKLEAQRKQMKQELAKDEAKLRAAQEQSGYSASLEATYEAQLKVGRTKDTAFRAKPTTVAGALAILELIEVTCKRAHVSSGGDQEASHYQISIAARQAVERLATALRCPKA